MGWEEIVGHSNVITILKNMLTSDKIPHSTLLSGPAGLGKMLVARILAAGLLCQGPINGNPCGTCPSCRQIEHGGHPDFSVLADDGGSLKIDQIRALKHEAALAPYYGQRRVFVIEEAQRLTTEAANSLLKILEEPPAGTVFILTAVSTYALLPTIVSRCLIIDFHPLSTDVLIKLLTGRGADASKAGAIARLSGGRVGAALVLLNTGGLDLRDQAVKIIAGISAGSPDIVWETALSLEKMASADLGELLRNFSFVFRDLFVIKIGEAGLVLNLDMAAELRNMAGCWSEAGLSQALEAVKDTERALDSNANSRLTCEALLIKLVNVAKRGDKDADGCRHTV